MILIYPLSNKIMKVHFDGFFVETFLIGFNEVPFFSFFLCKYLTLTYMLPNLFRQLRFNPFRHFFFIRAISLLFKDVLPYDVNCN